MRHQGEDNLMKAINFALLRELYRIDSYSENEKEMSEFVQEILRSLKIDFNVAKHGAVYAFYEKQPLLSAHMDRVFKFPPSFVFSNKNFVWGTSGIGADDVNGVFSVLKLLSLNPRLSFAFSTCEEGGKHKIGATLTDYAKVLKTVPYGIVLDRRGGGDIICKDNSYGSTKFEEAVVKILKKRKFKPTTGIYSDANALAPYMSCCNLSVGYYNPHTDCEYTNLNELCNTIMGTVEILSLLHDRFEPYEYKVSSAYYPTAKSREQYQQEYDDMYGQTVTHRDTPGSANATHVTYLHPLDRLFAATSSKKHIINIDDPNYYANGATRNDVMNFKTEFYNAKIRARRLEEKRLKLTHSQYVKKLISEFAKKYLIPSDGIEKLKYCENCGDVSDTKGWELTQRETWMGMEKKLIAYTRCKLCGTDMDYQRAVVMGPDLEPRIPDTFVIKYTFNNLSKMKQKCLIKFPAKLRNMLADHAIKSGLSNGETFKLRYCVQCDYVLEDCDYKRVRVNGTNYGVCNACRSLISEETGTTFLGDLSCAPNCAIRTEQEGDQKGLPLDEKPFTGKSINQRIKDATKGFADTTSEAKDNAVQHKGDAF
jgi:tripeptide aminopeptidase